MEQINRQIQELQQLLSSNEVLIDQNIDNLLSIRTNYENFQLKLPELELDRIQSTLFDLLEKLQLRYEKIDGQLNKDYARDESLSHTYSQLTTKLDDPRDLIRVLHNYLGELPTKNQHLANIVHSTRGLVDITPRTNENIGYLNELIGSVEHVIETFADR